VNDSKSPQNSGKLTRDRDLRDSRVSSFKIYHKHVILPLFVAVTGMVPLTEDGSVSVGYHFQIPQHLPALDSHFHLDGQPVLGQGEAGCEALAPSSDISSPPFVRASWLCKSILPIRNAETRCYDSVTEIGGLGQPHDLRVRDRKHYG
jgi:hypothetical protein